MSSSKLNVSRFLTTAVVAAVVLSACAGGAPTTEPGSSSPTSSNPTASTSASASPSDVPPEPSPSVPPVGAPDPQTEYASADELTVDLVDAERAIRDVTVDLDDIEPWARAQQAMYRVLARTPEWQDPVLTAMPDGLREVAEQNLRATAELRALTSPREELPDDWMIVTPPAADELLGHYRAAGDEFGVDWTYLAAIHLVETRMGRIRGTSTAGAQGPMQFMPATWDAYGEGDVDDPHDAIRAAARYLIAHGAPGDMDNALWAYNHSDRYVQAVKDHAAVMRTDERAYHAYYHWQVYYRLTTGDVILEEGWQSGDPT
jgi:hypothetical protein